MTARAALAAEAPVDEAIRRMGEMLASAIRHGALLDQARWPGWIDGVQHGVTIAGTLLSVELPPTGEAAGRRWFADPVTALLIVRWHRDGMTLPAGMAPDLCLASFTAWDFREGRVPVEQMVERACEAWRFHLPGLLHAHAKGEVPATSVPAATWARIAYGVEPPGADPVPAIRHAERRVPSALEKLLAPDFAALREAEQRTRYEAGRSGARRAKKLAAAMLEANPTPPSPVAAALRAWTVHVLRHEAGGRASTGYAITTVRAYLKAIAPVLTDWRSPPFRASAEALERHVRHALATLPRHHRARAANALRAFQRYANTRRTTPLAFNLDGSGPMEPVTAELVLPDTYRRARQALLRRREGDAADCLTLLFRAGLRLKEVVALRTGDLAVAGNRVELVIEENGERALKTPTSRRILPLDVLLEDDELSRLLVRARLRSQACETIGEAWLFGSAAAVSPPPSTTLSESITAALRQAAGSPFPSVDHLRHSFASFLLATLLLPQDAMNTAVPARLASVISPQRFARVIDRLLGEQRLGAGALHAVSQLMGHTGPATTLRHYCHLLDLSLGFYCARPGSLAAIDPSWLMAALDVSPEAGRKALARAAGRMRDTPAAGTGEAVRPDAAAILASTPHVERKLAQVQLLHAGMRRAARPLARAQLAQAAERSGCAEPASEAKQSSPKPSASSAAPEPWPVPWRMILSEEHRSAWTEAIERLAPDEGAKLKDGAPADPVLARFVDRHLILERRPRADECEALFRVVYRFKHGRQDIRLRRLGDAVAFVRLLDIMGFERKEVGLSLTSRLAADLGTPAVRRFLADRATAPQLAGRSGWRGSLVVRLRPIGLEQPIVAARACRFALTVLAIDLMAGCPSATSGPGDARGIGRHLPRARPGKRKS